MKRMFGWVEIGFDIIYLVVAFSIGLFLLITMNDNILRLLSSIMAFVLVGGDFFHLLPRIQTILSKDESRFRRALGRGKKITSITMTLFYVLMWYLGLMIKAPLYSEILTIIVYALAFIRIILCLLPQNKWDDRYPPLKWGILRNIPFFILGLVVAYLFFINSSINLSVSFMWLAILLSYGFYLPVVLYANQYPKIGMLMLPKTSVYIWMLWMFLSL